MDMDLESLKYAELQRLAKDVGLKANMKAEKLLKALKQHFHKPQQDEVSREHEEHINMDTTSSTDCGGLYLSQKQQTTETTVFATKCSRHGRQAAKTKESNPENNSEERTVLQKQAENELKANVGEKEQTVGQNPNKRKRCLIETVSSDTEAELVENSPIKVTAENEREKCAVSETGAEQVIEKENCQTIHPAGKIPRLAGLLNRKTIMKPTTPNFKKLHEAHFSKLESIDSYIQRKNKQIEAFKHSVKEVKITSEKANILKSSERRTPGQNSKKSLSNRSSSLFSPKTQEKKRTATPYNLHRSPRTSTNKPNMGVISTFKPTILSARKINVRFAEATKDNDHKRSLVRTPSRMSQYTEITKTPTGQSKRVKPSIDKPSSKLPVATPFKFEGATAGTPRTNKKNTVFDLKASLARPLAYQPHKGKLKPVEATKENKAVLNKPLNSSVCSHQKNYKQHPIQTRGERREKHFKDRKQKKDKILRARRGLAMN
ncbi:nucleolar and spindle-associated protein 1-like [Polyodon spathula]|uniref:nucleolar and spindle-associated protein 1-like n=1 Tax=Polyodon spathula TaxID=7913 RepID=UPI001B7EFFA1|nr:nucleolar and spindle-associated protein 1-like [Polyodon spathula]